jgi:diadenosine tetraphosphate (Ap4A) HIT family hydrolase
VTEADCYTCTREAEFDRLPPRERIALDEHWRVVHATGSGLLGWLVLTPRRHVMELADLTDDEARGLGDWQVRLARALTAELGTGAAKVYVAEFGEKPGFHLHFHVVPRAVDFAEERRGPGVFGYLNQDASGTVAADACDELALRLSARLGS